MDTQATYKFGLTGELVAGLILGLIPWGLSLLGVQTNIWLGGCTLLVAFGLMAHYFWLHSSWHWAWRVAIVAFAGSLALGWIAMRMREQYLAAHPPQQSPVRTEERQQRDLIAERVLNPSTANASPASKPMPRVPKASPVPKKQTSATPSADRAITPKKNVAGVTTPTTQASPAPPVPPVPPAQNCPQGICIGGDNSGSAIVNNYGPPPLQLVWSVDEFPPDSGTFRKKITIHATAPYSPVAVAIYCDADIESVEPLAGTISAIMGLISGRIKGDKKTWWFSYDAPAVTPERPLLVFVSSNSPFNVLKVVQMKPPFH